MTVSEVINKVDILRRNNQFTIGDKMRWLNECEAKIQLDCLLLPNVEIVYDYEKDADEELIAKLPFDELYIYYICSHIDEALGDEKAYNNSIARYNAAHHNYQKWLIENVDPKRNKVELTRPEPVIYRGDKTTLTIYNLPADASEIAVATMELSQKLSVTNISSVQVKGNTMTAVLTELQTFNLKEGCVDVGFSITTTGGATYRQSNVQRYYVKEPKELYGDANGVPVYVDKSLTISGRAADAAETGKRFLETNDKIGGVRTDVSELQRSTASNFKELETDIGKVDARVSNLATLKEGSTTGDAELIDIRMDFNQINWGTAGKAVRGQVRRTINAIRYNEEQRKKAEKISRLSNGHLELINIDRSRNITIYQEVDGKPVEYTGDSLYARGTEIMKSPKYLAFNLTGNAAVYVYFYKIENGEFKVDWNLLDVTNSSKIKNRVLSSTIGTETDFKRVIQVPDGYYVQIGMEDTEASSDNEHDVFGWDGEPFGIKLSADPMYASVNTAGTYLAHPFSKLGSCTVTIPGNAEYVIFKGKTNAEAGIENANGFVSGDYLIGFKGDTKIPILKTDKLTGLRFYKLPRGYDYFRLQMWAQNKNSIIGDVSEYLSVIAEHTAEKPSGKAKRILENCEQMTTKIRWSPKAEVVPSISDNATAPPKFQPGVIYNGIPYSSEWKSAHYVGWHVSPHTFINAVNDEDSIFYKERVGDGSYNAPYYGTVCSAYAQFCCGWPYPEVGTIYDPKVITSYMAVPQIGEINVFPGHVVIPAEIYHFPEDTAIAAYESIRPLSMRSTRYEKVSELKTSTGLGVYVPSSGKSYYDKLGSTVHHRQATGKFPTLPYFGLDEEEDLIITGGTARPYKGDMCVYTSEEAVKINIKDTSATTLYLQKKDEATKSIVVASGTKQIDVKNDLDGDGLYFVWTDKDQEGVKESFEYRTVETLYYRIDKIHDSKYGKPGGTPVFIGDGIPNFWYAEFSMNGDISYGTDLKTVSQPPAADYSYLITDEIVCTSVYAVFRKGEYGAYAVPVQRVY